MLVRKQHVWIAQTDIVTQMAYRGTPTSLTARRRDLLCRRHRDWVLGSWTVVRNGEMAGAAINVYFRRGRDRALQDESGS